MILTGERNRKEESEYSPRLRYSTYSPTVVVPLPIGVNKVCEAFGTCTTSSNCTSTHIVHSISCPEVEIRVWTKSQEDGREETGGMHGCFIGSGSARRRSGDRL